MRVHNLVVSARQNGDTCGGWSKQATLARVVGCFTGIDIKHGDAEYIGNAQDYFLTHYNKNIVKALNVDKVRTYRARSAGKELPANLGQKVREIQLQIYSCKFGGVPRSVVVQGPERIPFRHIQPADEVNQQLQLRRDHQAQAGRE